jgi:hypothetical protein
MLNELVAVVGAEVSLGVPDIDNEQHCLAV